MRCDVLALLPTFERAYGCSTISEAANGENTAICVFNGIAVCGNWPRDTYANRWEVTSLQS